jgi:hypothetical protein
MVFNCPGHESHRKGLSGCGIDTVNAPVDTIFFLLFTVSDFSFPPATSTAQRIIKVVSPCEESEIYCPDLAKPAHPTGEHACGTTECVSRAAILALQPPEVTDLQPSVVFSSAVPVSAVSNTPPRSNSSAVLYGHKNTVFSQVRASAHSWSALACQHPHSSCCSLAQPSRQQLASFSVSVVLYCLFATADLHAHGHRTAYSGPLNTLLLQPPGTYCVESQMEKVNNGVFSGCISVAQYLH